MIIGRLTNLMSTQQVIANISQSQDALATTAQELSSGKRINQPSDDPYGASMTVALNGQLAGLATYSSNVNDATAYTKATDASLKSIENMVQRVRELVVGAANGTTSQSGLNADAAEVSQLTAAIKQEANSQYNGQYIFSGTASGTAPYATGAADAYQGNSASVNRAIGPNSSLQVNADLSQVLGSGQSSADGKLLDVLRNITQHMTGGTPADMTALGNDLSGMDANLSTLAQTQAKVGATVDRLQLATTRIQSLQTAATEQLSSTQDVDLAATMTQYSNEQAAFTAALKVGANIVQSSLMNFLSNP